MEKIIIKHLELQYKFTLSTLQSYQLVDRYNNQKIYIKSLFNDLEKIFGVSNEELLEIWDIWAERKILELNNRITEIRYQLYEATGVDSFDISINEINKVLINDNLNDLPNDR
jgi:hypothetical protein